MARLIDADALIAKITDFACKPCKEKGRDYDSIRCRACQYGDEIEDIESAEELDAVPVVRCKDCKWWKYDGNDYEYIPSTCYEDNENHFCSYGERKENE